MSGEGWQVAAATAIGSAHVREHLPNQDSVRHWTAPDGAAAVVVVADGHGHPVHGRSAVGSDLATACTLDALRTAVAGGGDVDPVAVGAGIVDAWRRAVLEHVEQHPLRSDEGARGPYVPYGTTLLALAATPAQLVVLQVGDGDTVVVRPSGEAWRPLPEDPSLDGVHTTSLCQPDPLAALRTATLDLADDPLALALVCTDGLGKAADDPRRWWASTAADLATTAGGPGGVEAVRARLPVDVRRAAALGGDDTTLGVLAQRSHQRASRW